MDRALFWYLVVMIDVLLMFCIDVVVFYTFFDILFRNGYFFSINVNYFLNFRGSDSTREIRSPIFRGSEFNLGGYIHTYMHVYFAQCTY